MSNQTEFLKELDELVKRWEVKTSDDRYDRLQQACDEIRQDCADELKILVDKYNPNVFAYFTGK